MSTNSPADPAAAEPPRNCPICPRLVAYRHECQAAHPDWWNAPVPGFGDPEAWLCIVGLAPGVTGANRTGRPFTGDFAGTLLYETLAKFGLSEGQFDARADDGLTLNGTFITNSVRCVPPQNKPDTAEIHACRPFLSAQLAALPRLKVVLALGTIAHQSALKALGAKLPKHPFAHAAVHHLHVGVTLVDSYHCSRYNTNTGRLTAPMFEAALAAAIAAKL